MELITLYRHEKNVECYWTDYNKCLEDYLKNISKEKIIDAIESFVDFHRMFNEGIKGNVNFFQELYTDAVDSLCGHHICEAKYDKREIEELEELGYVIIR